MSVLLGAVVLMSLLSDTNRTTAANGVPAPDLQLERRAGLQTVLYKYIYPGALQSAPTAGADRAACTRTRRTAGSASWCGARPHDEAPSGTPHRRGQRRKGKTSGIDLNTATEEELDALWGVGPQTARKIVEFRQREGRINSPEDLHRIDGMDSATVQSLQR
ncbi:MAG TPA: helix-hairpin-helix domain-containing protein [Ramlibacter sp.]|nr:helix-hairpin-helix domain-containing protein [Ramlibacter sp.]